MVIMSDAARAEALAEFIDGWYDRWAGPGESWTAADLAAAIVEWQASRPVTDAEVTRLEHDLEVERAAHAAEQERSARLAAVIEQAKAALVKPLDASRVLEDADSGAALREVRAKELEDAAREYDLDFVSVWLHERADEIREGHS